MSLDHFLSIILSLAILGQALFVRQIAGTWLFPACIFSIVWFLFTFIPLLIVPLAPANPLAIGYILACCILFSAGGAFYNWRDGFKANKKSKSGYADMFEGKFITYTFYFIFGLAMTCWIIDTAIQGVSFGNLYSNYFSTSSQFIVNRYSDNLISNIFYQIANIATYMCTVIAGLMLNGLKESRSRTIIVVLSLIPSSYLLLVQGAKGTIFLCIALIFGGHIIDSLWRGKLQIFSKSTVFKLAMAGLALIPLLTLSFLARGLYEQENSQLVIDGLYRYFVSYSASHLYAFSDWFSWYTGGQSVQLYNPNDLEYGFYTFMSVFQLFGDQRYVVAGTYAEYFKYSWYLQSNIYTWYRGLIIDFGIFGSFIFMYISSIFTHLIYLSFLKNKNPLFSSSYIICFVGFCYTSLFISLFTWRSIFVIFAITSILIGVLGASLKRKSASNLNKNLRATVGRR